MLYLNFTMKAPDFIHCAEKANKINERHQEVLKRAALEAVKSIKKQTGTG